MHQITLSWMDNNDSGNAGEVDEDAFKVYRSLTPIDTLSLPAPLATLPVDTTSYVDTAIVQPNAYYYIVSTSYSTIEVFTPQIRRKSEANSTPTITVVDTEINYGVLWHAIINSSDADGDTLTFTVVGGPAGMTTAHDGTDDVVEWPIPIVGTYTFDVVADDGFGGTATFAYVNLVVDPIRPVIALTVDVTPDIVNQAPVVTTLSTAVNIDTPIDYQMLATDNESDDLYWTATDGTPVLDSDFSIDIDGFITGQRATILSPTNYDIVTQDGHNVVTTTLSIEVVSILAPSDLIVDVTPDTVNQAPVVTTLGTGVNIDTPIDYQMLATDNESDDLYWTAADGTSVLNSDFSIDIDGFITGQRATAMASTNYDIITQDGHNPVTTTIALEVISIVSPEQLEVSNTLDTANQAPVITTLGTGVNINTPIDYQMLATDNESDDLYWTADDGTSILDSDFSIDIDGFITGQRAVAMAPTNYMITVQDGHNTTSATVTLEVVSLVAPNELVVDVTPDTVNQAPIVSSTGTGVNINTPIDYQMLATDNESDDLYWTADDGTSILDSNFSIDIDGFITGQNAAILPPTNYDIITQDGHNTVTTTISIEVVNITAPNELEFSSTI